MNSFRWNDFLALAETLEKESREERDEGKRRTAISRAYYASYHASKEYASRVLKWSAPKSGDSVHVALWNELSRHPGKTGKVGNQLRALVKLRRSADYESPPAVLEHHVRDGLSYARQISGLLRELDQASSEPTSE